MSPEAIPDIFQIGSIEAFLGVGTILVGMGVAWGTLKRDVEAIETKLTSLNNDISTGIVPSLYDIRERFVVVEDRVETLWRDKFAPSHSPRQLNEHGRSILAQSGIQEIIDEKQQQLLEVIRSKNPTTAYDAENEIIGVVSKLREHYPDIIDRLKDGAFKSGADIDAVLFVGGIYLRDTIFPLLGFSLEDIA